MVCLSEEKTCSDITEVNWCLLIKETNECVEYFPLDNYSKKFEKTCLSSCPVLARDVNNECIFKWYEENQGYYCTVNFPDPKKPILVEDTNECVESCKITNNNYPLYCMV